MEEVKYYSRLSTVLNIQMQVILRRPYRTSLKEDSRILGRQVSSGLSGLPGSLFPAQTKGKYSLAPQ